MLVVQAAMAGLGILIFLWGSLRLGRREVSGPIAKALGLVLIAPLPITLIVGAALSVGEGWTDVFNTMPRNDEQGQLTSGWDKGEYDTTVKGRERRNFLLSLALTCLAGLGAVALFWAGLRDQDAMLTITPLTPARTGVVYSVFALAEPLPWDTVGPPEVRHYEGDAHSVPSEIAVLGRAKQIHLPSRLPMLVRAYAVPLYLLGLTLLASAALMLLSFRLTTLGVQLFTGVALLGGFCLVAPLLVRRTPVPTCLVFGDALVLVRANTFTVIPWRAIAEFHVGHPLQTRDGQQFDLDGPLQDRARLEARLMVQVTAQRLPDGAAAVKAGQVVEFGPFQVTAAGLHREGRVLAWDAMALVRTAISTVPPRRQLAVWEKGAPRPWCNASLDFPNDFLFLELVRHVSAQYLHGEGARANQAVS